MKAQFVKVTLVEGAEIYLNTIHIVSISKAYDKDTKKEEENAVIQLTHKAFNGARGDSLEVDETPEELIDALAESEY